MKKLIVIVSMLMVVSSAFASEDIPAKVLYRFEKEFFAAKDVQWKRNSMFIQAQFIYNEKVLFAFYSLGGQFIGVARNISPAELPVLLQSSVKNNYAGSWITDLFELSNAHGATYFITLDNGDGKKILKSQDGRNWKPMKEQL